MAPCGTQKLFMWDSRAIYMGPTTITKMMFDPAHLSRQPLDPESMMTLVPVGATNQEKKIKSPFSHG